MLKSPGLASLRHRKQLDLRGGDIFPIHLPPRGHIYDKVDLVSNLIRAWHIKSVYGRVLNHPAHQVRHAQRLHSWRIQDKTFASQSGVQWGLPVRLPVGLTV